jgi:hypothetical protein
VGLFRLLGVRAPGYRFGPPPWARFWWGGHDPTKTERKESLEDLKQHLEEELAEVTKELGTL